MAGIAAPDCTGLTSKEQGKIGSQRETVAQLLEQKHR